MNEQEYAQWENDANWALTGKYTGPEANIIIGWFRSIDGRQERNLIGDEAVDAFQIFCAAKGNFNLYDSLMSRLFIYAPLILKEYKNGQTSS